MIEVTLIGNLTADVMVRDAKGGEKFGTVTVAVNRKGKNGNNVPDYIRLIFPDSFARSGVMQYLTKGKQVYVRGDERVYTHAGTGSKTYVNRDVRVKELQLLGGRQDDAPESGEDDCPFPV